MYYTEEEFVSLVDSALKKVKPPRDEYSNVLKKYSWDSVARDHIMLFTSK